MRLSSFFQASYPNHHKDLLLLKYFKFIYIFPLPLLCYSLPWTSAVGLNQTFQSRLKSFSQNFLITDDTLKTQIWLYKSQPLTTRLSKVIFALGWIHSLWIAKLLILSFPNLSFKLFFLPFSYSSLCSKPQALYLLLITNLFTASEHSHKKSLTLSSQNVHMIYLTYG